MNIYNEVFVDIKGYEGLYQISNFGNVKSLPKSDGNGKRERILKFDISGRGKSLYHRITICKDSKSKRISVHRLVCLHFIPNPKNKPCVNHIDNNGKNNRVENLEWCTHKENSMHCVKQGRHLEAINLGTQAASAICFDATKVKMKGILGGRFLELKKGPHGNVCSFLCVCGKRQVKRNDSVIIKRGGICRECNKKNEREKVLQITASN